MDYNYRSPLQDGYYTEDYYHQHGRRPWPPSSRPPHTSHHRDFKPYARPSLPYQVRPPIAHAKPSSSNQDQDTSYSSRYKVATYPKELNDMFGALECKLCAVEASSPIVAKMHYGGKQHLKKVKNFMTEWSQKTGKSIDNLQPIKNKGSITAFPDYCELCDVRLLSTNDKIAHCSGKQHKKNERDPLNAKRKNKTYDTIDLSATDARFGIGIGFSSDVKPLALPDIKVKDFVCELCDVKAVSQEQLNIHLVGKSHQHQLKKKESSSEPKPDRPYKCEICNVSLETPRLYRLHIDGKPHEKKLKKLEAEYRGGTCDVCSVSFTTYKDYQAHLNGKKHEKKLRQNALRTPVLKDCKAAITCKNCPYIGNLDDHVCDKSLENIRVKTEQQSKWQCVPCYNMEFDTAEEYEEHKKTRRHLLCMLNIEGEKICEDIKHWYCFTCRKQYHSHKEYCDHLFELKHMTLNVDTCDLNNKTDLFYCSVCALVMDQQAKDEHMISKSHLIQAAQQDITQTLTTLATQDLGTQMFHCTHCDVNFFNFISYSDHLLDRKHLEEIILTKL